MPLDQWPADRTNAGHSRRASGPARSSRVLPFPEVRRTNELAHCGGPSPSPRSCSCSPSTIAIRAQLPTGGRWRGLRSPSRRPGEIGQARGRDFTWPRAEGDAVSRYGMGMSLAQIPAAWMAPRIEARLGPGASQPLFLIVPLLCVCAAAAAAGWIALGLGLSAGGVAAAVPADGTRLSSWILRITRSVRAAPGRRSRTEPGVQPDIESRVRDTEVQPPLRLSRGRRRGNCAAHEIKPRGCDTVRVVAAAQRGTRQEHAVALSLRWRVWRCRSQVGSTSRSQGSDGSSHPTQARDSRIRGWMDSGGCSLVRIEGCGLYFPALVIAMLALGDLLSAAVTSSAARGRSVDRHLRRVADDRSWMVGLAWALGMGPTAVGAGYPSSRGVCRSHPRSVAPNGPIRASGGQHDSQPARSSSERGTGDPLRRGLSMAGGGQGIRRIPRELRTARRAGRKLPGRSRPGPRDGAARFSISRLPMVCASRIGTTFGRESAPARSTSLDPIAT